MRFASPLLPGRLIRRYKRFFADVRLDSGETVTAHTPNTGTMLGCAEPESRVWLSHEPKSSRKLQYTWEIATDGGTLVGVHTGRTNHLAREAIEAGRLPELRGYDSIRREVRYGQNSRIDLLLEGGSGPPCYVEVKNVTLARSNVALFPDAVTERGTKHLRELMSEVKRGHRAAMLFVVQREDCHAFAPADAIDPVYGKTLRLAAKKGVVVSAWMAKVSPEAIRLNRALPVLLD